MYWTSEMWNIFCLICLKISPRSCHMSVFNIRCVLTCVSSDSWVDQVKERAEHSWSVQSMSRWEQWTPVLSRWTHETLARCQCSSHYHDQSLRGWDHSRYNTVIGNCDNIYKIPFVAPGGTPFAQQFLQSNRRRKWWCGYVVIETNISDFVSTCEIWGR